MKPTFFATPQEFRAWLEDNHETATELLVGLHKKGSGKPSITWPESVEEAEDPAAKKAELIEAYRGLIDVYVAARNDMVDDVIDPRETRPTIVRGLRMAADKRVDRPWKKHGVMPV